MAGRDEAERDQAPLDDADTGREVEEDVRALEEGTGMPQTAAGAVDTSGQAESQGNAGSDVPPSNDKGDPT